LRGDRGGGGEDRQSDAERKPKLPARGRGVETEADLVDLEAKGV
jgi:hypothetical protein